MKKNPTTVSESAQLPVEEVPVMQAPIAPPFIPPRMSERRGGKTVPYTRMYPLIKGGQCDKCGTLDKDQEAIYQYKLCPHFRGMGDIACTYCDSSKDPNEVNRYSTLKIHDHPYEKDPYGQPTLVVVCDSYECSTKHTARFDVNAR